MKRSNLAEVIGRRKCRKVLTKAAVQIQKRAMHIGTTQQKNQNLRVHGDFICCSFKKCRNDYQEEVSQHFHSLFIHFLLFLFFTGILTVTILWWVHQPLVSPSLTLLAFLHFSIPKVGQREAYLYWSQFRMVVNNPQQVTEHFYLPP